MPCAKGMNGCARTCLHRQMVRDYHVAREADEQARERETRGHTTEDREYDQRMVTFKKWLIGLAGRKQAAQHDLEGAA